MDWTLTNVQLSVPFPFTYSSYSTIVYYFFERKKAPHHKKDERPVVPPLLAEHSAHFDGIDENTRFR
jgi:hypothetical protein